MRWLKSIVRKKTKWILFSVLIFLVVVIASGIYLFNRINQELENLPVIEQSSVDLSTIEDGVYEGVYKTTIISVIVEVTIENHQIIKIEIIEHDNGQGAPANAIVDDVIEAQSLDVDYIAGATYSSKVILLAIEDALS